MPEYAVTVTETIKHERIVEAPNEEIAESRARSKGTMVGQEFDTIANITDIQVHGIHGEV